MTSPMFLMLAAIISLLFSHSSAVCPSPCQCSNQTVNCSDNQLSQPPNNLDADTERLFLTNCNLTNLTVAFSQTTPVLVQLTLNRNQIADLRSPVLGGLFNLTKLDLSDNQLTEIRSDVFADLHQLLWLGLANNQISHIVSGAFRNFKKSISTVLLHGNQLELMSPEAVGLPRPESPKTRRINLTLFANRWHCNCSMWSLKRYVNRYTLKPVQQDLFICTAPSEFANRSWISDVTNDDLCDEEVTWLMIVICAGLLITTALILVWIFVYRMPDPFEPIDIDETVRAKLPKKFWLPQRSHHRRRRERKRERRRSPVRETDQEMGREPVKEEFKEMLKEQPEELTKEEAKEQTIGQTKEPTKGQAKELAKEQAKEQTKGQTKELAKEQAKEQTKGQAKELAKQQAKESTKGQAKGSTKIQAKESTKGQAKGPTKIQAKKQMIEKLLRKEPRTPAKEQAKKQVKFKNPVKQSNVVGINNSAQESIRSD